MQVNRHKHAVCLVVNSTTAQEHHKRENALSSEIYKLDIPSNVIDCSFAPHTSQGKFPAVL
jgi:hypothetical protein